MCLVSFLLLFFSILLKHFMGYDCDGIYPLVYNSNADDPNFLDRQDDEESEYPNEDYDDDDFLARRRADQRRLHERKMVGRWRKIMTFAWAGLILFWLTVFYGFVFQEMYLFTKVTVSICRI